MDSAWFVRPGPNPELRYSLRSAHANAGVERVWIIGDPPDWYTGPRIPGNPHDTKQRNVYANVQTIAEHVDLPEHVAIWNDDMYATEPVTIDMAYRSTLTEHIQHADTYGWWGQSLKTTRTYLWHLGHRDPLSYELHRPFPVHRPTMTRILAAAANFNPGNPPQWRTLYGNLADAGGHQDTDGKITGPSRPLPTGPWYSSSDHNFPRVARLLADLYPDPSPWET